MQNGDVKRFTKLLLLLSSLRSIALEERTTLEALLPQPPEYDYALRICAQHVRGA